MSAEPQRVEQMDRSDRRGLFQGSLSGWMIFLAGVGLLVSVLMIPAGVDLREARLARDRALARETHELKRIGRYSLYLAALDQRDETLMRSLAMSQLQLSPGDRDVLLSSDGPLPIDLLSPIEPGYEDVLVPNHHVSLLERLATDGRSRLWLLAGAAMLIFLGALPASRSG